MDILSSETENAHYFLDILDQVSKGVFLRKWAKIVGKNLPKKTSKSALQKFLNPTNMHFKMLEPIFSQDNEIQNLEDQQEKNESIFKVSQEVKEQEKKLQKPVNVCFGDIIYLKAYVGQESQYSKSKMQKGVISGDGIASNKLECIPHSKDASISQNKSIITKNGSLMFRKCLFQVVNTKKYYYHKLLKKAQKIQAKNDVIEELKRKAEEEKQENDRTNIRTKGQNIIYGQEIQLYHLFSNTTLRLNKDILAHQNCCREMSLEEEPNEFSNFLFGSVNNAKKQGEPIMYGDQVQLQSGVLHEYWLNINNSIEAIENFDKGLEVNSSEDKANLKFCCYMNHQKVEDIFKKDMVSNNVNPGDIIILENRSFGGKLGVKRKQGLKHEERTISFEADQQSQPITMVQEYFNPQKAQQDIKPQFVIMIDTEDSEQEIQCLWEIQKEDSFISTLPKFSTRFRLKNVATGLYLYYNEGKLTLTYNGNQEQCLFFITPKKSLKDITNITYNQQVKIQSVDQNGISFMYALERQDKEIIFKYDKTLKENPLIGNKQHLFQGRHIPKQYLNQLNDVAFVQKERQDKKKRGRTLFDIRKADKELSLIADRVSSLYPYLFDFYIFLQDWGLEFDENGSNPRYTHKKAFENQRDINNHINQLYQSLENLQDFLNLEGTKLKFIQKILLENGIINILIQILKLCHFQIYGNPKNKQKTQVDKLGLGVNDKKNQIPERSAQKIASFLLDSKTTQFTPIGQVYNILYQCIRANSECAAALLNVEHNYLQFFLQQLDFYPQHVKKVLRESVQFMEADDEKEEENLTLWIQLLDTLSESNIEKQTFIVELLGLSVSDSLEKPLLAFQNIVRKKIFKPNKITKQPALIQKTLISLRLHNEHPIVYFNLDEEYDNGKKWCDNNFTLYDLNRKATMEKKANDHQNNFHFQNLHTTKFQTWNKYDMGLIDGQIEQKIGKRNTGTLEKYENYLINVLLLYGALCKGRNKKMIDIIQKPTGVGLTQDFIRQSIDYFANLYNDSKKHQNMRYYRCFLQLYEIFILDLSPLIRISEYCNKCFVIQDLKQFKMSDKTYKLFKDIAIEKNKMEEVKQKLNFNAQNSEMAQHEIVKQYADYIIKIEDESAMENSQGEEDLTHSNIIFKDLINGKNDLCKKPPELFNIDGLILSHTKQQYGYSQEQIAQFTLEAFLQWLKIVRIKIELGYHTMEKNMQILDILPFILEAYYDIASENLLDEEDLEEEMDKNNKKEDDHWTQSFFKKCMRILKNEENSQLLITKVLIEAINILQSVQKLQLEMEIISKIKQNLNPKHEQPQASRKNINDIGNQILPFFNANERKNNMSQDDEDLQQQMEKQEMFTLTIYKVLQKMEHNPFIKRKLLQNLIYTFNVYKLKQEQMALVEIIDDEYELSLFRKVNGTSDVSKSKSPEELRHLVNKSLLYIQHKCLEYDDQYQKEDDEEFQDPRQQKKIQQLADYFEQLNFYLDNIINMFELSDFEKVFSPEQKHKTKQEYQFQLQNIIRNAGVYSILLDLITEVKVKKFKDKYFLEFYQKLVTFFEFFIQKNRQNKASLVVRLRNFLDLALIPYNEGVGFGENNKQGKKQSKQIKISDLCKSILKYEKLKEGEYIADIIDIVFQEILENSPFIEKEVHSNIRGQTNRQLTSCGINQRYAEAVLQYMKVLRSLTLCKEQKIMLEQNQKKILSTILKEPLMLKLVQPIQEIHLKQPSSHFQTKNEFLKLKLHIITIQLMTDSCKNYRLGIQEIQRFIMFDSLKNAISEINAPYMLKRAYLRCLFEVYINKVTDRETGDSNETITIQDISEVISKEIIPQLDPKNIYQYIEGIIKPAKGDSYESVFDMRKGLIKEKINFFQKYHEYATLAQEDELRLKQGDVAIQNKPYVGVIYDSSEYWRYISKEGIIHFLLDAYDERLSQLENYKNPEEVSTSLDDDFSHAKTNLLKLKQLFSIIETNFLKGRGDNAFLDKYRGLVQKVEDLVPLRTISKFGTNYRIMPILGGFQKNMKVEQFNTYGNDIFQGIQNEKDDKAKLEKGFKKDLRRFLTRYRIDVDFFVELIWIQKQNHKLIEKAIYHVINGKKKYSSLEEIKNFVRVDCNIKSHPPLKFETNLIVDDFTSDNKLYLKQGLKKLFSNVKMIGIGNNELEQVMPTEDDKEDSFTLEEKKEPTEEEKKAMEDEKKKKEREKQKQLQIKLAIKEKQLKDSHNIDEVNMEEVKTQYAQNIQEKITTEHKNLKKDLAKPAEYLPEIKEEGCELRLLRDCQVLKLWLQFANSYEQLSPNYDQNLTDEEFEHYLESLEEYFQMFLETAKLIFHEQKIYLLKLLRIYMEARAPRPSDLELLKSDYQEKKVQGQRKIDIFKILQKCCVDQKIHIIALNLLSQNETYFELEFESLNLLIWILYLGNSYSQNQIYNLLKDEDRILCMSFFHYLRIFFQQDLEKQTTLMAQLKRLQELEKQTNQQKGIQSIFTEYETQFEVKAKLILTLLQQMCENVNIKFQIFLREQSSSQDQQLLANTNMILEVSNFLSFFLENENLNIQQKDEIICHSLDALNEFCTGHVKNQKIVCNNKRLFIFINNKIIVQKDQITQHSSRSFKMFNKKQHKIFLQWHKLKQKAQKKQMDNMKDESEKDNLKDDYLTLKDFLPFKQRNLFERYAIIIAQIKDNQIEIEQDFNMFSSAIKFLLVMLTGNKDLDSIKFIIQSLNLKELLKISRNIYIDRIKSMGSKVKLEEVCECRGDIPQQKDDLFDDQVFVDKICCSYFCEKGNLTPQDNLLIETGFNIYIFFSYLADAVPQENDWIDNQDQNILDLFRFTSLEDDEDDQKESWYEKWIPCLQFQNDDEEEEEMQKQEDSKFKKQNRFSIYPEELQRQQKFEKKALQSDTKHSQDHENTDSLVKIIKKEIKLLEIQEAQTYEPNFDDQDDSDDELENVFKDHSHHQHQKQLMEEEEEKEETFKKSESFFKFYKQYLGTQEIIHSQTNQLQKVYFQKPFTSQYVTDYVKEHLIYGADRGSDQERISYLLEHYKFYYDQMNHKQNINKYWGLSYLVNNWRTIKDFSFQIVLLICIIFIIQEFLKREGKYDNEVQILFDAIFQIATIVQIVLAIFVLIFCSFERFTISVEAGSALGGEQSKKIQRFKESAGFQQNILQKYINNIISKVSSILSPEKVKESIPRQLLMIMADPEFLYNVAILIITYLSYNNSYFYFVLLLDIVKRYPDLQSVLKAITQNLSSLAKFGLLGVAVMYIYAIIGWEYFNDDFADSGDPGEPSYDYQKTFVQLVAYVIKEGLRSGGGITEAMNETETGREDFWQRYSYDLSFFIIINMLFVQMIFGIIIDTFGDLRGSNDELMDEITKKCFICGHERAEIDQSSDQDMGWYHHIYLEHNVYHMLYYMIYVDRKHENECDALEKSVKQSLVEGKINFVPIGYSLHMGILPEPIEDEVEENNEEYIE